MFRCGTQLKKLLASAIVSALLTACGTAEQAAVPAIQGSCPWPQWHAFKTHLLDDSGRVVDRQSADGRTVSEGQAYALLFALVANDRETFESLLKWTQANLAQGDLTAHLPAWLWGQKPDGRWAVLDSNPASDADLWMAYALLEAGRLWQSPHYQALGELLASRVLREEVDTLPGLGPTLLPAPHGFYDGSATWRLNPSYAPPQVLRYLATRKPGTPWAAILESSEKMISQASLNGFAPDWVSYAQADGFSSDTATAGVGSYDAIRVYLWLGMLHPQHPGKSSLLNALSGMKHAVLETGVPPEQAHAKERSGTGPSGFSAALLPYLASTGDPDLLQLQLLRLKAKPIPAQAYYQQMLGLFGQGWHQGEFRFGPTGELQPRWESGC